MVTRTRATRTRAGMALALALLLATAMGLWPGGAYDAAGELDPSFGGGDGKVTADFLGGTNRLDEARAVAIRPDGKIEWHGKVQRVVDGESHQFDSWQGLVELLLAMLPPVKEGRSPEDGQAT